MLMRKTKSSLGNSELPHIWRNLKLDDFQLLIKNLDPSVTGYVDVNDLLVYLCLLSSPVLNLEDEAEYRNSLIELSVENGKISK